MKKNILTYEGLKKYESELEELKIIKRQEVAQKIKEAREQGDLSENDEYDAAKDEQRDIEARIEELENIKLEESDYTEEIGNNYYENYEIVSGEHLSGKIINITDKYLKIQKENMEIKLVEIDWKSTNFVNYRTKESLTPIFLICIGVLSRRFSFSPVLGLK